jgi:hypothetical protein
MKEFRRYRVRAEVQRKQAIFEACEKEKQEYFNKVDAMEQQLREISANNKYESKHRDLKESFQLYRKKAKEIFEAQQQQQGGGQAEYLLTSPSVGRGAFNGGEDAKLAYPRNLMVNYLCSDVSIRDPMEVALKTVLQFTPEDIARIEKAKKANKHGFNNIVKQIIILFYFSYLHILLLLKKIFSCSR